MTIKEKLDEYLEFNSDELFIFQNSLVRIFGGAIRDIIVDMPIHDIDILCGSKSISKLEYILYENGYTFSEMLSGKDIISMYDNIKVICEPKTYIKNNKIVQIIKPSLCKGGSESIYKKNFNNLISNVDISCCGVSWDGELHEDYPNAILHCKNKVFAVNKYAKMYNDKRIFFRKDKLFNRGWKEIKDSIEINRDLKINIILK